MATRSIILERDTDGTWRYALWATVPGGLEPIFASPIQTSAFRGATSAQISALRAGTVAERTGALDRTLLLAAVEAQLQTLWQQWQNEVTASPASYGSYGRSWDGAAWTAGTAPPLLSPTDSESVLPTFFFLTPESTFAASRFHLVLFNNTTGYLIRLLLLLFLPSTTARTGALPSAFTLRRRVSPTSNPAGGNVTAVAADPDDALNSLITGHAVPTTAPAGGISQDLLPFFPQPDEVKLSTLDAPTFASVQPFCGQAIYNANAFRPARPFIARPQQTIEVQQSATAGTGQGRFLAVISVSDMYARG